MSDKGHQREILIDKRAQALAMMLLTRREDLRIEQVNEDIGLDYIVRFLPEGKEELREFGIELKGVWASTNKEQANKVIRSFLRQRKRYGCFPRPVCLFLFTMENDEAWYAWITEPIRAEDGEPRLRFCDTPDCRQLDNQALKEIIDRVDGWYDDLCLHLVVNGPGQSKSQRKRAKP